MEYGKERQEEGGKDGETEKREGREKRVKESDTKAGRAELGGQSKARRAMEGAKQGKAEGARGGQGRGVHLPALIKEGDMEGSLVRVNMPMASWNMGASLREMGGRQMTAPTRRSSNRKMKGAAASRNGDAPPMGEEEREAHSEESPSRVSEVVSSSPARVERYDGWKGG